MWLELVCMLVVGIRPLGGTYLGLAEEARRHFLARATCKGAIDERFEYLSGFEAFACRSVNFI